MINCNNEKGGIKSIIIYPLGTTFEEVNAIELIGDAVTEKKDDIVIVDSMFYKRITDKEVNENG